MALRRVTCTFRHVTRPETPYTAKAFCYTGANIGRGHSENFSYLCNINTKYYHQKLFRT